MTARNRSKKCTDCGTPVKIWALRCKDCREKRKAMRPTCIDCGVPISDRYRRRCKPCAQAFHNDHYQGERAVRSKFTWWHTGPPVGGFAISGPGSGCDRLGN